MKASILAIGTELTTGQIINKNAATLSEKLKGFGVQVFAHLTVPDDKTIILDSLRYLENKSDLLFITGGLGPTSDDFTRDVVAEWGNCKMIFDDTSWQHINERLTSRGFNVRDMQKQQCYFPENSKILSNAEGTAHAFSLKIKNMQVYVLPGPPREIEAVWRDHLRQELLQKTSGINKTVTRAWDTLGTGESDVAFQVEEALKNRPRDKFFEIGYRVHLPYVEVKLTFNESESKFWQLWVDNVEKALRPICITRDFADVADLACKKITDLDFTFYDFASDGHLHKRLSSYMKTLKKWSFKQSDSILSVDFFENEDDFLALLPYEDDKCILIYSLEGERRQVNIEAPMKSPLMSERRRQYFAEMALVELVKP